MNTYTCVCGQLIFFDSISCVRCKRVLGFMPDAIAMSSFEAAGEGTWSPTGKGKDQAALYRKCKNYSKEQVCNWMIPQGENEEFCASCRLNEIIPDLSQPQNRPLWARAEAAKRRLIYSLLRMKLPMASNAVDAKSGLAFRFMSDATNADGSIVKAVTGHDNGTITLNIAEADDPYREKIRKEMREPYRTLLGHFRHESGHYYWDRLVRDTPVLGSFRELFGDEQTNYAQSLQRHYENGAPVDWQEHFISAYATAHPWEDWAETFAHLLHIQDALEVAYDFGLIGKRILLLADGGDPKGPSWLSADRMNFDSVIGAWAELAIALNGINRSMGLADLYPFVLSRPVIDKLRFAYDIVQHKSPATETTPSVGTGTHPAATAAMPR